MVQLASLLLLVVAWCSTFSSAETATTPKGEGVAYNKFKATGGGGKRDLEKARKFIKVFESRVNRWSSILNANNSGVDGTSVRLSQSNLARIKALTEAELKVDKDSRTLDHIEKDLVTEAEDKTKNVTSETLAGDWMRNRLIADILDRLKSYMKSSGKVILLKSGKKIHSEMNDYVNDGEEGDEFVKAEDDCEEECDDPANTTLSTKAAKQTTFANDKAQLGFRQPTQPGSVHQVVKKDEVSYPWSKVAATDGDAKKPIPAKGVKYSNGRDRPLANTTLVPPITTTVSSIQKTTPKTIQDDPAALSIRAMVQDTSAAAEGRTTKRTPQFFTLGATFLTIGVMLTGSVVCSIVYFALSYKCRQMSPIRLPTFLTLFAASRTSTNMRFYRLKDDDTSLTKAPEKQEAAA